MAFCRLWRRCSGSSSVPLALTEVTTVPFGAGSSSETLARMALRMSAGSPLKVRSRPELYLSTAMEMGLLSSDLRVENTTCSTWERLMVISPIVMKRCTARSIPPIRRVAYGPCAYPCSTGALESCCQHSQAPISAPEFVVAHDCEGAICGAAPLKVWFPDQPLAF